MVGSRPARWCPLRQCSLTSACARAPCSPWRGAPALAVCLRCRPHLLLLWRRGTCLHALKWDGYSCANCHVTRRARPPAAAATGSAAPACATAGWLWCLAAPCPRRPVPFGPLLLAVSLLLLPLVLLLRVPAAQGRAAVTHLLALLLLGTLCRCCRRGSRSMLQRRSAAPLATLCCSPSPSLMPNGPPTSDSLLAAGWSPLLAGPAAPADLGCRCLRPAQAAASARQPPPASAGSPAAFATRPPAPPAGSGAAAHPVQQRQSH